MDYDEWLKVEAALGGSEVESNGHLLEELCGKTGFGGDPMEIQRKMRSEWPDLKVFDTNALVAIAQGKHVLNSGQVRAAISIISKIEILAWPGLPGEKRAQLKSIIEAFDVIDINKTVEMQAIDIRLNRHLKPPDAIIAATALSLNAPLVTHDGAFKRIPNLVVESI